MRERGLLFSRERVRRLTKWWEKERCVGLIWA